MNWLSSHKVGHQLNRNVDVQVMYVEYMYNVHVSKMMQYIYTKAGMCPMIQPALA